METAEQELPTIKDDAELLALLAAGEAFTLGGFKGLPDFLELLTKSITDKWQSFMSMDVVLEVGEPESLEAEKFPPSALDYLFSIATSGESELSMAIGSSCETFLQHVDVALGGAGDEAIEKSYDDLTPAEQAVFPQISQIFIDGFCSALSANCEIPNFDAGEAQLHEAIAQWMDDKEIVQFHIEVHVGDSTKSLILLVPIDFLEPLKDAVIEVEQDDGPPIDFMWIKTLEDMVEQTEIDLQISLGTVQLSIGEINNLTPNTLLEIETDLRHLPIKDGEGRTIFNANLGKDENLYQLIVSASKPKKGDGNATNVI